MQLRQIFIGLSSPTLFSGQSFKPCALRWGIQFPLVFPFTDPKRYYVVSPAVILAMLWGWQIVSTLHNVGC
ncbi:MAG: hypothetical protein ACJA13_000698 [Paraglaciecola sp.]